MKKKEDGKFLGTEFLVLGVGTGSSDPAGKLQIIQQQIDGLQSDWPELRDINDSIQNLEKLVCLILLHLYFLNISEKSIIQLLDALSEKTSI